MELCFQVIVLLIKLLLQVDIASSGYASTWSYCLCDWDTWKPWSTCNSTCYGTRVRTRSVWIATSKAGCDKFTDCASSDMGSDYTGCNEVCQNGGTYDGSTCVCRPGYYGSCCVNQVNCGSPAAITNGYIIGSVYTYGSGISYTCNTNYNITDGDQNRSCQLDASWSGQKPRCGYVNSCSSNPCMNGATCINIIDGYTCTCALGWSGATCAVDVQPPVAENCSTGINVTTEDRTETVDWSPPKFTDPMGQSISTHTNYPQNQFEFGWGDFSVQYVSVKPSNGMSSECLFEVKVRPNPCPELQPPLNGVRVCNNWKTDFGLYCLVFCTGNHTLSRGISFGDWFVCGASGMWTPSGTMPGCIAQASSSSSTSPFRIDSCDNQTEIEAVKTKYIEHLKSSEFSYFCDSHSSLCKEENVLVTC